MCLTYHYIPNVSRKIVDIAVHISDRPKEKEEKRKGGREARREEFLSKAILSR